MKPCLKSALLAAAALVFGASSASAASANAVNHLGLLAEQVTEVEFWSAPRPRGHYTDTWIFSVGQPSMVIAFVLSTAVDMRQGGIQLTRLSLFVDDYPSVLSIGALGSDAVGSGMESFLEVLGYVSVRPGHAYSLEVQAYQWGSDAVYGGTIRTGSLVPEPGAAVLIAAGLYGVATEVHRRRRRSRGSP